MPAQHQSLHSPGPPAATRSDRIRADPRLVDASFSFPASLAAAPPRQIPPFLNPPRTPRRARSASSTRSRRRPPPLAAVRNLRYPVAAAAPDPPLARPRRDSRVSGGPTLGGLQFAGRAPRPGSPAPRAPIAASCAAPARSWAPFPLVGLPADTCGRCHTAAPAQSGSAPPRIPRRIDDRFLLPRCVLVHQSLLLSRLFFTLSSFSHVWLHSLAHMGALCPATARGMT